MTPNPTYGIWITLNMIFKYHIGMSMAPFIHYTSGQNICTEWIEYCMKPQSSGGFSTMISFNRRRKYHFGSFCRYSRIWFYIWGNDTLILERIHYFDQHEVSSDVKGVGLFWQGTCLLKRFTFDYSMGKYLHQLRCVGWTNLPIH